MNDINVVKLSLTISAWIAVAFLAYLVYKRQDEKTQVWKIALLLFAGFFSFSITFPQDGVMLRLAILPLGIMVLSYIFRNNKERWSVYRKYAWLGFWANYIFLITSLLSSPIHSVVYPEDRPSTYLANFTEPSIMVIHPSGEERTTDPKNFEKAIPSMTLQKDFPPLDWYYEMENHEPNEPKFVVERFPYIVNGVAAKWGSGIHSIVYMERDGKGVLISSPKGQYYFRSEHALFEEGISE